MNCEALIELVTDYFEDVLDQDTRTRFEQHLEICAPCRIYLDQMRDTLRITGSIAAGSLDDDVRDALLATFRSWASERSAP